MAILDNVKELVSLVQKMDNLDLYRKILELQTEAQKLTDDIRLRDSRVKELEDALAFKGKMVVDGGNYFEADDQGKPFGKPFCSRCWEVDHRAVHVQQNPGASAAERGISRCPQCKAAYNWRRPK